MAEGENKAGCVGCGPDDVIIAPYGSEPSSVMLSQAPVSQEALAASRRRVQSLAKALNSLPPGLTNEDFDRAMPPLESHFRSEYPGAEGVWNGSEPLSRQSATNFEVFETHHTAPNLSEPQLESPAKVTSHKPTTHMQLQQTPNGLKVVQVSSSPGYDSDLEFQRELGKDEGPVAEWLEALKRLADAASDPGHSGTEVERAAAQRRLNDAIRREAEARRKKDEYLRKLQRACCPVRIVCKKTFVHDRGDNWKACLLDVYAEWEDPGNCDCDCCVYRQYVKGYHVDETGKRYDQEHELAAGVRLRDDVFQEDGANFARQGERPRWAQWGRRNPNVAPAEVYTACSVKLRDWVIASPANHGKYLTFKLQIRVAEGCPGAGNVAMEKEITVTMPEDDPTPGVPFDRSVHGTPPPADWPAPDDVDCK